MRQRVRGSSGSSRAGSVLVPALLVVVMMSALCMSYVQLSLTKNREVGLIATEPAAVELVARTFETDWSGASSF